MVAPSNPPASERFQSDATGCGSLDANGPVDVPFEALPPGWVDAPIVDTLRRVALRWPDQIAIRDQRGSLSYAELVGAVDRLAAAVAAVPRRSGAIGILLPNSAEQPVAMLAALAAGRLAVPFDLHDPPARIAMLMRGAMLDGVVVAGDHDEPPLPPGLARVTVSATREGAVSGPPLVASTAPGGAAIVLHTSGSSGRPKPVVVSQASLLQRVAQHVNASHVNPSDHLCPLSSPCTISGVREQLAALLTGATLHVLDPRRCRLDEVRSRLADWRVTVVYGVPALLRAIVSVSEDFDDFDSLRVVRLGGDTVLWRDVLLFRKAFPATCHVQVGFSSTESPGMQWFVPPSLRPEGASVPLGYRLPGLAVEVLDEAGRPARPGDVGELVVRGRFVALGLWEGGACVPGPFHRCPESPDERTYASGDLVRLRPDGLYEFAGRKDRQIKVRGQRIDASEVEAALRAVPGVSDAAVVAVRDGDETSIAAFVEASERAATAVELDAAMRALPVAMRPRWLHRVAIPRLPSAKPDLVALQALDRDLREARIQRPTAPTSSARTVEQVVARAWREALGPGAAQADATWADAGGDSLRLLSFALQVERRLGRDLPLELFDADMGLGGVATAIQRHLDAPRRADDALPLIFFFPGIDDDGPSLARFRRLLHDRANFETVEYPDWTTMVGTGGGMDQLVDVACARIMALPPDVPVRLAAYSFGGVVALALGLRLLARGRPVEWLAVFDTDLEQFVGSPGRARWEPQGLATVTRRLRDAGPTRAGVRALTDLAGLGVRPVLRRLTNRNVLRVAASRVPRPGRLPRGVDLRFRSALRLDTILAWTRAQTFCPHDVPVSLFRTGQHPPAAASDLGWSLFSRHVEVVEVDGEHATMFHPRHTAGLAATFARQCLDAPEPVARRAPAMAG